MYSGEIQIKLIDRGDCFYDITKIKDITNSTAGQTLIKAAGSVSNVSIDSIPQPTQKSNSSDEISLENSSDKQFALNIDSEGAVSEDGKISGAEVMGWLKDKPKSDGKLDLEATVERGLPYKRGKSSLTVGELKKVIANSTKEDALIKANAVI